MTITRTTETQKLDVYNEDYFSQENVADVLEDLKTESDVVRVEVNGELVYKVS